MTEIFGLFNREYLLWAILPLAEICDLSYVVRARFNFICFLASPSVKEERKNSSKNSAKIFSPTSTTS